MTPTAKGSFRLFQAAGVTVFLHWSWFLVAAYQFSDSANRYQSKVWNAAEYLALFTIVLMHEFGHALACRQVGGQADQIVLWPFGGVAYVTPPQRPGATLWSIAAGPLVNVVLFVILTTVGLLWQAFQLSSPNSDFGKWFFSMWVINVVLLVFNLLPIYPLDGGQIVRSLLWFLIGRSKSLLVASILGLVGVALLISIAAWQRSVWFGLICAFILINCWRGLQAALVMGKLERLPRRSGFACPNCANAPTIGAFWLCDRCGTKVDTFEADGTCPKCAAQFMQTRCIDCGAISALSSWVIQS